MARHSRTISRPSKITIPEHCHPLAKVVFAEMRRQGVTYDELEHRSGVLRSTAKEWRKGVLAGVASLDSVLGALGWRLSAIPFASTLPPSLWADLAKLLDRHAEALPCLRYLPEATIRRPYGKEWRGCARAIQHGP